MQRASYHRRGIRRLSWTLSCHQQICVNASMTPSDKKKEEEIKVSINSVVELLGPCIRTSSPLIVCSLPEFSSFLSLVHSFISCASPCEIELWFQEYFLAYSLSLCSHFLCRRERRTLSLSLSFVLFRSFPLFVLSLSLKENEHSLRFPCIRGSF